MFDLGLSVLAAVERSPDASAPVGKILRRLLVAGEYRLEQ
jgi:hypothetical protein